MKFSRVEKMVAGTIIIFVGLGLFLNNLGLIFFSIFSLWPLLFIFWGYRFWKRGRKITGGILLTIGILNIFQEWFGIAIHNLFGFIFSMFFIYYGIRLIRRKGRNQNDFGQDFTYTEEKLQETTAYSQSADTAKQDDLDLEMDALLKESQRKKVQEKKQADIQTQPTSQNFYTGEQNDQKAKKESYSKFGPKIEGECYSGSYYSDTGPDEPISAQEGTHREQHKSSDKSFHKSFDKTFYDHVHIHNPQDTRSSLIGDYKLISGRFELKNMRIWQGIGDVVIDLSRAVIPEKEGTLVINGWIGDVTIYVPVDMPVQVMAEVTIGELEVLGHRQNGITRKVMLSTHNYAEATEKVKIIISLWVGDIDVKYI
ncbi:cell wall-active antibiotics response protein LiaF [Brevibacillus laterosporus]|uniref:cell wall-active antibiotics response protein LiaF n=1 Tax=Brevibacillus laterosporus TaxID=1465 RepID=UPI0003B1C361|nr:cell wall-active antibiotics response protein LiaF [Brevibacillus laterosporus]ERM17648.1 membrane protein [Brevibacillus laterosporus PE36]